MKYWSLLLVVCLLLTGCQPKTVEPQSSAALTSPAETTTAAAEETTLTTTVTAAQEAGEPLLDQGEAAGEGIFYIPNSHVESFSMPQMQLFGNSLLLVEYRFDEEGESQVLKRISLEDGSLMAENELPAGYAAQVQIGNGALALYDNNLGHVTILDEKLEILNEYEVPYPDCHWYMNQELTTVYIVDEDKGIRAWELSSGEEKWTHSEGMAYTVKGTGPGYLIFEYTNTQELRTYTRGLSLERGVVETLPIKGTIRNASRSTNNYLFCLDAMEGRYTVAVDEGIGTFQWKDSSVQLLRSKNQLLLTDVSGRNLSLYDIRGKFVSSCQLPEKEYAATGSDFVWSGYWSGYFFTDTWDGVGHLMFWDVKENSEGTDLAITFEGEKEPVEPLLDASLYKRAEELSEKLGVTIAIGEQCQLEYTHYETTALTDPVYVDRALTVVDAALSRYPEGFLQQLCYGSITEIRIELVGELVQKEGMGDYPEIAGGFAQDLWDVQLVALDARDLGIETMYHEFSHLIDRRLDWYAQLFPEVAYSEEAWLAVQPEGFSFPGYYLSPNNLTEELKHYLDSGYFVRAYSMSNPTEDRATLMALAMNSFDGDALTEGQKKKMRFYAQSIRECFDTAGWPEEAPWEIPLS